MLQILELPIQLIVNALLAVQDSIIQTWIIDNGASSNCIPSMECFLSFFTINFGTVYLGNYSSCNIEGLSIASVAMENGHELKLDQVHFVLGIKKSLLSVGQLDLQGYSTIFTGGAWKIVRGTRLIA